ncbi:MAG: carbon storage regulator [Planctomycetia bacterium]|jgi:carbon storage regulator CsrA|nr:carbon storage regulator [Planctomycetia bacterium]
MLVLTRRIDEQIRVGDEITITIVRIKGHSVRIGVDAPRDVAVRRSELETGLTSPQQSPVRPPRQSGPVRQA